MRDIFKVIALCIMFSITLFCSMVFADEGATSKSETSARNAALENLQMKILALKLTPSLTVSDFSDTNPDVREAVLKWLSSIQKRGKVTVAEDGIVTVTVAVSMKAIQMRLSDIYASYYDGKKIKPDDISNIATTNNRKEIQGAGTSTPAGKDSATPLPVPIEVTSTTPMVSPDVKTPPTPPSDDCWKNDLIPQQTERAKLMAELAAKKNALYRLGDRMRDVKVGKVGEKTLTVNDFIITSDQPNVDMSEFLRAARRTKLTLRPDMLVCEIQMQAELKPAIAILKSWADENYRGEKSDIQLLRDYVEKEKPITITEIGTGVVEPKYLRDGFRNQQEKLAKFAFRPPRWISETIEVIGQAEIDDKGNGEKKPFAVAKTDAIKAAKADAEEKFREKLLGLEIPGDSSIKNLTTESPELMKQLEGIKTEVKLVDDPHLEKDKIVRVKISTNLKPVWDMLLVYHGGINPKH